LAGKVLEVDNVLTPDNLGCEIARMWQTWDIFRQSKKEDWKELIKFLYATDTTTTTNAYLPWKNTTTTPKLTQIMDNLYANYMASMFPKRRWMKWEGASEEDDSLAKQEAIQAYMQYVIEYPGFKDEVSKLVLDYIQNGNAFVTIDWIDERVEREAAITTGYVGPILRRISPFDIVMNPTAPDFYRSPKIVRSIVSLGEVEELLQRLSTDDGERKVAEDLFNYLLQIRGDVSGYAGDLSDVDDLYRVDGFHTYRAYLESGYCEILTFYGDLYDREDRKFYKNQIIQVVDRHKIIRNDPNPTELPTAPLYHSGWRPRPDNLWAMGPLDNLVGLQYRLDHLENSKADFFDLLNFPPLKIKGYVEDFNWGPFEKIYLGDDGDVEILQSATNPLQANFELERLEAKMEQLAGAPREAMGFRTPGEKTAYEVQSLENAAGRIFQNKIAQFEEQILEPALNAMLEVARRKMSDVTVRVLDNEFNVAAFQSLTSEDINGVGRFRPIAARHFAEVAERVQNITNFYQSGIGADPEVRAHISSIESAKLFEELLDLQDFKLVSPYIRLTEQAEAQRLAMQNEEDTMMGVATPSGLTPDDSDMPFDPEAMQ
jgi:hypothetical protein